ncbi:MAG: hypothetical protein A3B99_02050 [Candidatus Yanofskybacteria bacterium RIFCSPHIGHO2_02_FULL_44_12b]|uniref:Uncharacterized protein n=2 Tax=Candidatus Yanofskyibacteriota TaxID=1752733 RepID=A0A1F8GQI7_9BACT|nr:MAG: hypothetical protein UW79_C0012G0003 [Candidatus Yanofskybacteria bacterium GW2011_GWA2_44_9]OGN05185.1 MAG: hypothetical protein A2659_04125 [Candidatus Yanofskybacteria bacterium RIFCSPHIGHO2_01_FULL_44_24]OGN15244.1 MAG: hypothetical protein A3B99_02050 [Candidatus Yanofskybacteria bacterium RIFCSPHIGHO2_02_FULL_44_12b]OGN26906.1 MAG: hypothetical protein A2925_01385 [Candidatus Yanofskybacteria bacterium RIFCSPLOWO2_01_FULL_44_22]
MIIQAQRRAIEALKPLVGQPWPQEAFANKCSFYIGQGPTVRPLPSLVLLGFSRGIGTCSDIKGIDVAVFGYRSFNREDQEIEIDRNRLANCAYSVLLWPRRPVEIKVLSIESGIRRIALDHDLEAPQATVELLRFDSFRDHEPATIKGRDRFTVVYLQRTGLIVSYVVLA